MRTPLINPATVEKAAPMRSAQPTGTPWWVASDNTQDTATTMIATIARSIPRPITTSPMPSPRIPKIETLRTSAMRFPGVKKLCSVSEKTMKSPAARAKTTLSCVILSLRRSSDGMRGFTEPSAWAIEWRAPAPKLVICFRAEDRPPGGWWKDGGKR